MLHARTLEKRKGIRPERELEKGVDPNREPRGIHPNEAKEIHPESRAVSCVSAERYAVARRHSARACAGIAWTRRRSQPHDAAAWECCIHACLDDRECHVYTLEERVITAGRLVPPKCAYMYKADN